jgi:membrane-associated phospholipid phosphatase
MQTAVALRWQPRVGLIAAIATIALSIGAVYGGFHYAVDVLAGAVLGVALAAAFLLRERRCIIPNSV